MIRRIFLAGIAFIKLFLSKRTTLASVTIIEIEKKYSGTIIGKMWVALYPLLLLSIYIFVYMVIFRVRFPGYSELGYTLYVFTGLIPYIAMSEALTTSCLSIKQNMHLIRNVMLPIDLVPVRTVLVSMIGKIVSLCILSFLLIYGTEISLKFLLLPVIFFLQILFLVGLALVLSSTTVVMPDLPNFVNLVMLLLMFISPIGFKPEMVPEHLELIVQLNPVHYMADAFRMTLLYSHPFDLKNFSIFAAMCIVTFLLGVSYFGKFKTFILDHE